MWASLVARGWDVILGNADLGRGAGDPTNMTMILEGNSFDPRATKWGTIIAAEMSVYN
jgi:hypothetical protein